MKIFYFTSTGNSLSVAKQFNDAQLISIPQALKNNELSFEDNEKIGVIFPTYAMSMPLIVKDFMSKVTLKAPYVFVIATCGSSAGGTIDNFSKIAKKRNIQVNYANVIKMSENYLPFADMANNSGNNEDKVKAVVTDVLDSIEKLPNENILNASIGSGVNRIFNTIAKGTAKGFSIEDSCTLCKTCEKVCPTKNISVNNTVTFDKKCISCFACTHNCPTNSIRFKKEKSRARYRNENVSLSEIIDSNNQF